MKKNIIAGIIIIAAVGIGWYILNPNNTFDYVATVSYEVEQLEDDLVAIDAAVSAGTLTSAEATEAKVKILTRLNTINDSVNASQAGKLTVSQQTQLNDGLNRLKSILITYQSTLSVVDSTAVEADVSKKVGKGKSGTHISLAIIDTIDSVEVVAEEVIADYVAEDTEVIAEIETETEAEVDMSEYDTESTDDTEVGDTMQDESDDTMEEGTTTETEIEAEAEIQVEASL